MSTAFITGANGFVGQHIVKTFLAKGHRVVGSVRTEAKGDHLKSLFKSNFEYVVVPDILAAGSFDPVFSKHKDISMVVHSAAPSFYETKQLQREVIDPIVIGTNNVLKAAHQHGDNVKRFVLTSTYGTIGMGKILQPDFDAKGPANEDTWISPDTKAAATKGTVFATMAGKIFSEKDAWNYVKTHTPQFTLATVHPAYAFGPQAFDSEVKPTLNASAEMINRFLKGRSTDPLPPIYPGAFYDVRDIAEAHHFAATSDAAASQRLLLANGMYTPQLIANILRDEFPELKDIIPVGKPGRVPRAKIPYDDSRTRALFQHQPRSLEDTLVDTVAQILLAR